MSATTAKSSRRRRRPPASTGPKHPNGFEHSPNWLACIPANKRRGDARRFADLAALFRSLGYSVAVSPYSEGYSDLKLSITRPGQGVPLVISRRGILNLGPVPEENDT